MWENKLGSNTNYFLGGGGGGWFTPTIGHKNVLVYIFQT